MWNIQKSGLEQMFGSAPFFISIVVDLWIKILL